MENDKQIISVSLHGSRLVKAENKSNFDLSSGNVMVKVDDILHFGTVIQSPCCKTKSDCDKCKCGSTKSKKTEEPIFEIVRIATDADINTNENNTKKEESALVKCKEEVVKHELNMKLVDVLYQFDGGKITFFFTADQRVDFRELVKSLASIFRTRIELRQIGVRDAAKVINGVGICGKPQCCSTFMKDFAQISTQQAKDQQLSLNPTKISGNCGRLLCCLQFEEEAYLDSYKKLPRSGGQFIDFKGKAGDIVFVDIFKERIQVRRFENGINNFQWYSLEEIQKGTVNERTEQK